MPLEAHEASSMYSEEKARFLRQVGEMIEDKDAELVVYLSSLNLEEVPNPGDHLSLPKELIECAAGMYSTLSNKSTVCTYCFWVQNPARTCLLETVRLLFLEKKSTLCNN